MYEEVKVHIQEMLDMGAIRPSNNPWASAVVIVWKKRLENYGFYQPTEAKCQDY